MVTFYTTPLWKTRLLNTSSSDPVSPMRNFRGMEIIYKNLMYYLKVSSSNATKGLAIVIDNIDIVLMLLM